MSWTDEEIDNLFREEANSQLFEYNDLYFNEVEAALPVNKRRKDFLWIGTAILFTTILTTGYFFSNQNEVSFGANDQLADLQLNSTDKSTLLGASVKNETPNIGQSTLNRGINSESFKNTNVNTRSLNSNTHNTSTTAVAVLRNAQKKQNVKKASSDCYEEETGKGFMYNRVTRKAETNRVNDSSQLPKNDGLEVSGSFNGIAEISNEKRPTGDVNSEKMKQLKLTGTPISASLTVSKVDELDQNLSRDVTANLTLPMLRELRPKSALYAEFNTGFSQSLITPSEAVSKSIGGGVGVESYLGNFSLTTGLNLKISYHDDLFLTRKGKVYGFGSQEGTNVYDFQRIYSLELPISLGYNFGRHNLNIGVRPSLVVGSKIQYQAFENNQLLRTEIIDGLLEGGLTKFGIKPTLGYSYRLKNCTIGASIGVQLMKSVNEEYIDGLNNQFPVDGQIYIRRTIRFRR